MKQLRGKDTFFLLFKMLLQNWQEPRWFLADTVTSRKPKVDHLYHTKWPFLFPPAIIGDNVCFRNLLEKPRMTNLLKDQEGVAAIQADIIVFGTSVVEHDARLQQVFADH